MIVITLCNERASLPTKGSAGAAGYDLVSTENVFIPSRGQALAGTGVRMKIPPTLYGRVAPRSGLAVRRGIDVGAGVIDSDYRGEIKVVLFNHSNDPVELEVGTKIAQIVFEKIANPTLTMVPPGVFDAEDVTVRGENGFGSTD